MKRQVQPQRASERTEMTKDVKIRTFSTYLPNELSELERIYNEAGQGHIIIDSEEKQWIPSNSDSLIPGNYWMIFLRWIEVKIQPKEQYRTEGVDLNASSQHPTAQSHL